MPAQNTADQKKWYEMPLVQSLIIWLAHAVVGTWYLSQTKTNLENANANNSAQIASLKDAVKELTVAMKGVEVGLAEFRAHAKSLDDTIEKHDRRIERLEQKR